jgi:hypothetical protein
MPETSEEKKARTRLRGQGKERWEFPRTCMHASSRKTQDSSGVRLAHRPSWEAWLSYRSAGGRVLPVN